MKGVVVRRSRSIVRGLTVLAVGLTVVSLLVAPASAAKKKGIPAKTWTGTIQFDSITGAVLTQGYFTNNSCKWNGNAQMNGVDGFVQDLTGYNGLPGRLTWTADQAASGGGVYITFLDSRCHGVLNATYQENAQSSPLGFTIPSTAKYAVMSYQGPGAYNVHVTLFSQGRHK